MTPLTIAGTEDPAPASSIASLAISTSILPGCVTCGSIRWATSMGMIQTMRPGRDWHLHQDRMTVEDRVVPSLDASEDTSTARCQSS